MMTTVFLVNLLIYLLILIKIKNCPLTVLMQSIFTLTNLFFYNFTLSSLSNSYKFFLSIIILLILNALFLINSKKVSFFFTSLLLINSFLFSSYYIENKKISKSNYSFKSSQPKRNIYFIGLDAVISSDFYLKYFSHKKYITKTFQALEYFTKDITSPGSTTLETYSKLVSYKEDVNPRLYKFIFSNDNSQFYIDSKRLGYKIQFIYNSEYFGIDPNNIYDLFYPKKNTLFNFCTYVDDRWGCYFCKIYNHFLQNSQGSSLLAKVNLFKKYNEHIFQDSCKWFSIIHIWYPGHTQLNYDPKNENDYKEYIKYYIGCQEELKNIITEISNYILSHDNDPIIIFMGDHGSWLFKYSKPNDIIGNLSLSDSILYEDKRKVLISIYPYSFGNQILNKMSDKNSSNLFRFILESADSLSIK